MCAEAEWEAGGWVGSVMRGVGCKAAKAFTRAACGSFNNSPVHRNQAALPFSHTALPRSKQTQAACIPLALAGRDICGSAVTGSGKTAAFTLPILERLLYRPRQVC